MCCAAIYFAIESTSLEVDAIDFWNKAWFEKFAPLGAGLTALALLYYFREPIATKFSPNGWQASNLYGAVFDWASIQSGFVFAIYGFIVTKKDGFVGAIAPGRSHTQFISFTRRACFGGFALTFFSLPLLVISPEIATLSKALYLLIAVWFAFFVWAFCAFLRVAFSFGIMVATPDRETKIAG